VSVAVSVIELMQERLQHAKRGLQFFVSPISLVVIVLLRDPIAASALFAKICQA
jgi:hypothetical protein